MPPQQQQRRQQQGCAAAALARNTPALNAHRARGRTHFVASSHTAAAATVSRPQRACRPLLGARDRNVLVDSPPHPHGCSSNRVHTQQQPPQHHQPQRTHEPQQQKCSSPPPKGCGGCTSTNDDDSDAAEAPAQRGRWLPLLKCKLDALFFEWLSSGVSLDGIERSPQKRTSPSRPACAAATSEHGGRPAPTGILGRGAEPLFRRVLDLEHDAERERKIFGVLAGGNAVLAPRQLLDFVDKAVSASPAFAFLLETPEYRVRYCESVVVGLFFRFARSKRRMTRRQFAAHGVGDMCLRLLHASTLSELPPLFSYEAFFVMSCKFDELDSDGDSLLNADDLAQYGNCTLSLAVIDRILEQPTFESERGTVEMLFRDFVWLLLAEEDKLQPAAVEFWFHCLDLDEDGVLSPFEIEHFWEAQAARLGDDAIPFADAMCAILDLVRPRGGSQGVGVHIAIGDLKRSNRADTVFNMLFSLTKYQMEEDEDPYVHDELGEEDEGAWEKFVRTSFEHYEWMREIELHTQ